MGKIITIANQKGGVGKTSTAQCLAGGLNAKGYRTLAVDLDAQENLSLAYGVENSEINICNLFNRKLKTSDVIVKTNQGDVIPGSILMAGADMEYTKPGREYILKEILQQVVEDYDYIIVDTTPLLGILTVNAMTAADQLIIPIKSGVFSLQGLGQLISTIDNVKTYCNKDLVVAGILITKHRSTTGSGREFRGILENIATKIGTIVYESIIREAVAVEDAQAEAKNIYQFKPFSDVAADYDGFVNEFLKGEI